MKTNISIHQNPRHVLKGFATAVVIAVVAISTAMAASAQAPPVRDFFGTVVSTDGGLLVVSKDGETREVMTSGNTKVRLPLNRNAELTDLEEGDLVAVSLEVRDGETVAHKIFLIPEKTQHRHVVGEITDVSDTQVTIQLPAGQAGPLTFTRGRNITVRFHKGTADLAAGSFVVILATRDSDTGELLSEAMEIHVVKRQRGPSPRSGRAEAETVNTADIRGVFHGVDGEGNWLIGDTVVAVGPDTEIKAALVVGRLVKVDALLMPDGSLLAREIESDEDAVKAAGKMRIEGIFQGVDDNGNWLISGVAVAIGPGTDTDGLPATGQRVKVKAFLQDDGSLMVREIENKGGMESDGEGFTEVKLEGTFQGVDEDGNWLIDGAKFAVDSMTLLEGAPARDRQIEVKAILREDGALLAFKIEGHEGDATRSRSEVKIHGIVSEVLDDALVVDGVTVALSELTEMEGTFQAGDRVDVEALLQADGSLVAREVEGKRNVQSDDILESGKVKIEGTLESASQDGTMLVVNGISVSISALTKIEG
ncbi:MAG: DUF5666 domain-containing protein, partial [Dehalococcoidia bacterium]